MAAFQLREGAPSALSKARCGQPSRNRGAAKQFRDLGDLESCLKRRKKFKYFPIAVIVLIVAVVVMLLLVATAALQKKTEMWAIEKAA